MGEELVIKITYSLCLLFVAHLEGFFLKNIGVHPLE